MTKITEAHSKIILKIKNKKQNRPVSSNKLKSVTKKNLMKKKIPEPESITGEINRTFKEEIISILQKLFQKIEEEGLLPNS